MPRALLSVSDKTGIVDLGRGLIARGFELVSTGGTARALAGAGLAVTSVSAVTGFPEMMDGRIKTLHPKIHGGILARRDRPGDRDAAATHEIGLIDLVVVNLYPFAEAAERPAAAFDELVEEIDIGGPSLIRAAAKNFADVLVVVEPADYPELLRQLDRQGGPAQEFRLELARKAFAQTCVYDATIAGTLAEFSWQEGRLVRVPVRPSRSAYTFEVEKVRDLRYGENPHQHGSVWEPPDAPIGLTFVQGKALSYTNLLDLDAAWRVVAEFDEPAAVVIKHTNPCGAATGASAADAYARARDADALSAFGGIVGLNRPLDADTARAIVSSFIEAIIAPSVADEARAILAAKAKMRVVTLDHPEVVRAVPPALAQHTGELPRGSPASLRQGFDGPPELQRRRKRQRREGGRPSENVTQVFEADRRGGPDELVRNPWWTTELRSVFGGLLLQDRDRVAEARAPWPNGDVPRVVTRRQPTAEEWQALRFAWRISAHVKSNAVIFTDAQRTLAIGAGQTSRVDAVNVAVMKARAAGQPLHESVAASDAFFPFRDGVDAIASAGATAVVQPGGSVRDAEVIAAADEHGLAMVFTGRRHFRH